MRFAFLLLFHLAAATGWCVDLAGVIPANCRAVVLVTSPAWSSSKTTLRCFERADSHAPWHAAGTPKEVLLGRHGLAWAAGLNTIPEDAAPRKKEGDGC